MNDFTTFEHFMAMYYMNYNEAPTLANLITHIQLYKTMKGDTLTDEVIEQIKKLKEPNSLQN
ncbi:hypothetical protein [Paenibacillus tyrfis]|uniref:hypothetical protein n=1 Tax=Paenibacillus tyrfis TaxID=1501230 RepID=UPI00209E1E83|nr:hypothetical protein [Paenibacillus tyrfis]MCP1307680.1 hypothetical protein [Paenibacillus tyrfis]